jgi:hypothetical protein
VTIKSIVNFIQAFAMIRDEYFMTFDVFFGGVMEKICAEAPSKKVGASAK